MAKNIRKSLFFWVIRVFYPLFLPFLVLISALVTAPNYFGVFHPKEAIVFVFQSFFLLCFMPGLALLIMRGLGMLRLQETSSKNTVIPLMVFLVFYVWYYLNIRSNLFLFLPYKSFILACCLSLAFAFFCAIFIRLSFSRVATACVSLSFLQMFMHIKGNYVFFNHPWDWSLREASIIFAGWMIGLCLIIIGEKEVYADQEVNFHLSFAIGVLAFVLSQLFFYNSILL